MLKNQNLTTMVKPALAAILALVFLVLLTCNVLSQAKVLEYQDQKAMVTTLEERKQMRKDETFLTPEDIAERMQRQIKTYTCTMAVIILFFAGVSLWNILAKQHIQAFLTATCLLLGVGVSYKFLFAGFGGLTGQASFTLIAMFLGVVVFLVWHRMGQQASKGCYFLILAAIVALMAANIFFGDTLNGSKGWLPIFGMYIQPAEFIKGLLVLLGACSYRDFKRSVIYCITCMAACFMLLYIRDLGGMAVLFMLFVVTTYLMFDNRLLSVGIILAGAAALALMIMVSPHAMSRLTEFGNAMVNKESYQQRDFITAVIGGGWGGLGLENASEFTLVYAANCDAAIAGIQAVYGLPMLLLVMGCYVVLILQAGYNFSVAPASHPILFQVATIIFTQTILNYAGAMDVAPFTGCTAVFLSTGGSATLTMGALMGLMAASLCPKVQKIKWKRRYGNEI